MIFQEKPLELKSSNNGNNRKVLDRKEKIVMSYIFVNCENGEKAKTRLFSSQEIVDVLAKRKYVVSTSELNEIMISLSKEGLIDFVQSESKKGIFRFLDPADESYTGTMGNIRINLIL